MRKSSKRRGSSGGASVDGDGGIRWSTNSWGRKLRGARRKIGLWKRHALAIEKNKILAVWSSEKLRSGGVCWGAIRRKWLLLLLLKIGSIRLLLLLLVWWSEIRLDWGAKMPGRRTVRTGLLGWKWRRWKGRVSGGGGSGGVRLLLELLLVLEILLRRRLLETMGRLLRFGVIGGSLRRSSK